LSGPLLIQNQSVKILDDDIFLLIALTAKVNYVVSFDSHLLDLEVFRGIPIIKQVRSECSAV